MAAYLVQEAITNGPATHAIVIGVGTYPHLAGGAQRLTASNDGMGQLTSPPVSARAFADWLIHSYHNPTKPLASVALLLSEPASSSFKNTATNIEHSVTRADIFNVKAALREWKNRGDSHPDNLLIFFFCGHGIAQGPDTSLLLADYGAVEANVLEGAIDFKTFQEAMKRQCAAKQQLFFVDACRVSSDTLIEKTNYVGDPILIGPGMGRSITPIFYSTLAGEQAFGRVNAPSYFTEKLLKALNGAGAHNQYDDWRVSTSRLKDAIDAFMNRATQDGAQKVQIPIAEELLNFDFHFLKTAPMIEVRVQCKPVNATRAAQLSCESTNGSALRKERAQLSERPWDVIVPVGEYQFSAHFANGNFQNGQQTRYVTPPSPIVNLNV
ncbi:MAG: caspase family protein [Bacteroidota bacterium]